MSSISIDEISAVSGFSTSHFMRFFKSAMGTSFTSYLSSYRLSMAARLLMLTNDSILDIALSCGYENLSYFNRLFRRKFGVTPGQYRGEKEGAAKQLGAAQMPGESHDKRMSK